nr:reverse transcriptase domain-containing protein [Tanacetum cinerariifolium]
MMDKKMHKRKFNDTSRNIQHQQQPPKRNNVAWAYTAGHEDRKPYGGTKHLCPKCNYHHDGPCAPKCTNWNRAGNGNVVARVYAVGTTGTNPNSNVVTGTKGVVALTRWLKKMQSVFQVSNCTVACQVKFASYMLQGSVLTWWNSHMRAIGQDVAYEMPWAALKRMITDKYCPRGEIQKLESEYWNLKV